MRRIKTFPTDEEKTNMEVQRMSMESAVAFYERLEKDVGLQEKLKELGAKENISQYVKGELGYDFSTEEMQKVIFERHPEMIDEELEAVVGGGQLLEMISQIFMSLLGAAA